jgi:RNA polymerase sigma factor (sigma-70 family)
MTDSDLTVLLRHLRKLTDADPEATDAELLASFTSNADEATFTTLVRRHGRMVLGVCRRILDNAQDAEDAFQATFLILARKAGTVRQRQSLASWLHGVARRVALKAHRQTMRRRTHERQATQAAGARPEPSVTAASRELQTALDEALASLPEKYRIALILCYFEGRTVEEAAREIGCPRGTVASRLAQGRQLLRDCLARRGLALSTAALTTYLLGGTALALPAPLLAATASAALTSSATTLSPPVLDLAAEGPSTFSARASALILLLCTTLFVTGVLALARPPATGPIQTPAVQNEPELRDQLGDPLPAGALARLGSCRLRPSDGTFDLVYTPDGKSLISARTDRVIQFWDARTGEPGQQLRQPTDFRAFVLSIDGSTLVTLAEDALRVWDVPTGRIRCAIAVQEGEVANESTHSRVHPLAVSADGRTVAVGLKDSRIRLHDTATGRTLRELPGQGKPATLLRFTPNGRNLLVVAGFSVRGWDLATARETFTLDRQAVEALEVAPDGKTFATGGGRFVDNVRQAELILRETATGREIRRFEGHQHFIGALTFAPDGKTLASTEPANDGFVTLVHLWDLTTGEELQRSERPQGHWVHRLTFAPDSRTLALSTWPGCEVIDRLDPWTGQTSDVAGPRDSARAIAFSPDGQFVVSAGWGSTIDVWDAATGRFLRTLPGKARCLLLLTFTPDGRTLLAGSLPTQPEGGIHRWDFMTGKESGTCSIASEKPALAVTVSADSKRMTTVSTERAAVWDLASGKVLSSRELRLFENNQEGINRLAVSMDGTISAEWTRKGVRLRDLATGEDLHWLAARDGERPTDRTVISPSGALVAAEMNGGWEQRGNHWKPTVCALQVWESATGKPILRIQLPAQLRALAFSPAGRTLAGAGEGRLQVWDVATGRELLTRTGQDAQGCYDALTFSPDGTKLAVAYEDTTALIWDLRPALQKVGVPVRNLDGPALDRLWGDLASDDAIRAQAAIATLVAVPGDALPALQARIRPAAPLDPQRLRKLVDDLDSPEFDVREAAAKELYKLDRAEPLREALARTTSTEVRRRLESILTDLRSARPGGSLRTSRTIQVLEQIGTPAARRILEALAGGDRTARSTGEAQAALERLARRGQPPQ